MPTAAPTSPATASSRDRWLFRLLITIAFNFAALILFPLFLTDALTPPLAAISGVPALWGLYTMLFFRTGRERIVGYIGALLAVYWAVVLVGVLSQYGWDAR